MRNQALNWEWKPWDQGSLEYGPNVFPLTLAFSHNRQLVSLQIGLCVWSSDWTLDVLIIQRMSVALVTVACPVWGRSFLVGRWQVNVLILPENLDITGCKGAQSFAWFLVGPICLHQGYLCITVQPCLRLFYIQELVSWNTKFTVAGSLRSHHQDISRVSLWFSPKQTLYDFVSSWSSFRFTICWCGSLLGIKWCLYLKLLWYWNRRSICSMLPFCCCSWDTVGTLIRIFFFFFFICFLNKTKERCLQQKTSLWVGKLWINAFTISNYLKNKHFTVGIYISVVSLMMGNACLIFRL